jgi:excisionase family DNA binding protein
VNKDKKKGWAMEARQKEVLTAEEAAEFLGLNPVTVRLKARSGEIPGRKIGKEWRFSRRQLLEWLEENSYSKAHA